jgi:hypothetical protein
LNNDELEYDEYHLINFKNQFENNYNLQELKKKNLELEREEFLLVEEIKKYEKEIEMLNESEFIKIEKEYWKEFNSFQMNLYSNQEEKLNIEIVNQ